MRYSVTFEFDVIGSEDILPPAEWDWDYVLRDFNVGFDIVKDLDTLVVVGV